MPPVSLGIRFVAFKSLDFTEWDYGNFTPIAEFWCVRHESDDFRRTTAASTPLSSSRISLTGAL